jgi:hypothetical protein
MHKKMNDDAPHLGSDWLQVPRYSIHQPIVHACMAFILSFAAHLKK